MIARAVCSLVVAGAVLLGLAPAALAHDELVSSVPGDATTVTNAPEAVSLGFSKAPLTLGARVVVTAPDGTVVSQGDPQVVGTDVVQGLAPDRPAGAYRVDWRVTSDDGHPIEGTVTFTAEQAVGAAPSQPSDSASPEGSMTTTAEPEPEATPTTSESTAPASASTDGDDGGLSTTAWTVIGALAGAAAGVVLVLARRRSRAS